LSWSVPAPVKGYADRQWWKMDRLDTGLPAVQDFVIVARDTPS